MCGMPCMLLPWGVFSQRRRQQQYWNEQRAPDGARWHLAPAFAAGIWRWHGSQAFGAGQLALVPALMGVLVLASAWSSLAQAWRPLQPRCGAAERGGAAVARAAEGSRFGRRLVQAFATPAACAAGWARLLLFSLLLSFSLSNKPLIEASSRKKARRKKTRHCRVFQGCCRTRRGMVAARRAAIGTPFHFTSSGGTCAVPRSGRP